MNTFLIILAICVVPGIVNWLWIWLTVKYNLWNSVMELVFSSDKFDESWTFALICPISSAIICAALIFASVCVLLSMLIVVILSPFKLILDYLTNYMKKILKKNEYYNTIKTQSKDN